MNHSIAWHVPEPLWKSTLQDRGADQFRKPEILRFQDDDFMDRLNQVLLTGKNGNSLGSYIAREETWRKDEAEWLKTGLPKHGQPVKLYQPAHQRYYLVTANLICRLPGLPDKPVNSKQQEAVNFVLRRLLPKDQNETMDLTNPATFDEYGWFGEDGWKRIPTPNLIDKPLPTNNSEATVLKEQRLPMFPVSYLQNKADRTRRLLAGFIPVSNREKYEAAPREGFQPGQDGGGQSVDPRLARFQFSIATGFVELAKAIGTTTRPAELDREREVLAFALLDLADFLDANFKEPDQYPSQKAVYDALQAEHFDSAISWAQALANIREKRDVLEDATTDTLPELIIDSLSRSQIKTAINNMNFQEGVGLARLVEQALASTPPAKDTVPGAPPAVEPGAGSVYVIRCVYERPKCKPYRPPVVSEPTQCFQLASFFDSDAPARPIRISMPVDTSISGLRKLPKNVSVLISDQLRKQMNRFQGIKLEDLDKGDVGAEDSGINLGMICSLSIPIITICALILLMIIVQLLNIVFWWLPFFKICLPLNLKGK